MRVSEKNALYRVLLVSRAAYSAIKDGGEGLNCVALLDSLSAALSHLGDEKKPLGKLLKPLAREIKAANKSFFVTVKPLFAAIYPTLDYDFDKASRHIPAVIYGNDAVCAQLVSGSTEKARSMCDALKSYPGYLFGEFSALSDEQFYDLVFGYYPKLYGEPFMDKYKQLFGLR